MGMQTEDIITYLYVREEYDTIWQAWKVPMTC